MDVKVGDKVLMGNKDMTGVLATTKGTVGEILFIEDNRGLPFLIKLKVRLDRLTSNHHTERFIRWHLNLDDKPYCEFFAESEFKVIYRKGN